LIVDWASVDLTVLATAVDRLDDQQLAAVDHIAGLPVPALPPAGEDHFLKCMRTLRLLPGRGDDELSGELRLNLYRRHLGNLPREALSFLAEQATLSCRWFPTPSECLDIVKRWERTDAAYHAVRNARLIGTRERQARLDDARRKLRAGEMSQQEADALPERWRNILMTEGELNPRTGAVRRPQRCELDD